MADNNEGRIRIPKFYENRHVLVTGGTGFIGKVVVEKLLRSCPDVAGVWVILREKKGLTVDERMKKMLEIPLFERLRKERPNFEEKLHAVNGDVALPNLGLSPEDRQNLIDKVSVVLHIAATVRFDDPLHKAIIINVRGTRDIAMLAREMPNLACFEYVGTTYCHVDRKVIEEKLYPSHGDWRKLISAAEKLDPATVNILATKLMGKLPNTYCFSKSLAEHCVHDVLKGKRFVVVRLVIVLSSFLEPVKGWVDNFNGPAGLFAALSKGIVHITLGGADIYSDYMPVDISAKGIIMAAYEHGSIKVPPNPPPIYNASSAAAKYVTTGEICTMTRQLAGKAACDNLVCEPLGALTSNKTVFLIGTLILHMIPAILVDAILRLAGRKPILVSMQRKIYASQIALAPFLLNTWHFKNDAVQEGIKAMLPEDVADWRVDYRELDPFDYFVHGALGGRKYLLKEKDEDLPKAMAHQRRVIIISRTLFFSFILWVLYSIPYARIATAVARPFVSLFEIEEDFKFKF